MTSPVDPHEASYGGRGATVGQRESPCEEGPDVDGGQHDRLDLLVQSVSVF